MRTMIATMGSTTQSRIDGSSSKGVWGAVAAIASTARGTAACAARREGRPLFGSGLRRRARRAELGSAIKTQTALQHVCNANCVSGRYAAALACCLFASVYTPLATRARLKAWRLDDSSLGSIYVTGREGWDGRGRGPRPSSTTTGGGRRGRGGEGRGRGKGEGLTASRTAAGSMNRTRASPGRGPSP